MTTPFLTWCRNYSIPFLGTQNLSASTIMISSEYIDFCLLFISENHQLQYIWEDSGSFCSFLLRSEDYGFGFHGMNRFEHSFGFVIRKFFQLMERFLVVSGYQKICDQSDIALPRNLTEFWLSTRTNSTSSLPHRNTSSEYPINVFKNLLLLSKNHLKTDLISCC